MTMRLSVPTLCAVCRGWSDQRLCADCLDRHAAARHRCAGCAMRLAAPAERCGACIAHALPFSHAVAALDYAFPWSGLIAALKFHHALDLAAPLAERLTAAVQRSGAPLPSLVLPVPLGRSRLEERGMNQAWELARRTARALAVEADPALLARRIETPHLADLPRDERAHAIRGAFALRPGASARLRGKALALVDDVMTTGATAAEAARTLLDAGAASVQLWVLARTP